MPCFIPCLALGIEWPSFFPFLFLQGGGGQVPVREIKFIYTHPHTLVVVGLFFHSVYNRLGNKILIRQFSTVFLELVKFTSCN